MSALGWLAAVRADLDAATPGPWRTEWDDADKWHSITGTGHGLGGGLWVVCPAVATVEAGRDADANLIASAPDRLDRMERALRAVLELAERWRYKGEFGFDDGSHAYGPDPEDEALDWASAELVTTIQEVLR